MAKVFLAILLLWVKEVRLILLSCDPVSANSGLLPAVSWRGRAFPGSGRIPAILSGSTQLAKAVIVCLRAEASCGHLLSSLGVQWALEGQSGQWRPTATALCFEQSKNRAIRSHGITQFSVLEPMWDNCSITPMLQHRGEFVGLFFLYTLNFSFKDTIQLLLQTFISLVIWSH